MTILCSLPEFTLLYGPRGFPAPLQRGRRAQVLCISGINTGGSAPQPISGRPRARESAESHAKKLQPRLKITSLIIPGKHIIYRSRAIHGEREPSSTSSTLSSIIFTSSNKLINAPQLRFANSYRTCKRDSTSTTDTLTIPITTKTTTLKCLSSTSSMMAVS